MPAQARAFGFAFGTAESAWTQGLSSSMHHVRRQSESHPRRRWQGNTEDQKPRRGLFAPLGCLTSRVSGPLITSSHGLQFQGMGLTSPSAQTASTSSYQILAKPKERLHRAKIFVFLNSFIVVAVLLTFKKQSMCLREINPNNAER